MSNIIAAKDLRPGHTIIYNNNLFLVLENTFNKTAMRSGIVKCKIKNLRTGSIIEQEFTGEKLEQAIIDKKKMTFSYEDDHTYVFMDTNTFEQVEIAKEKMAWEKHFLSENVEVSITSFLGEILGINLPDTVEVIIKEAEEAVRGNTATSLQKKAWLSDGFEIIVPQFVKTGDKVVVSTIDGKYKSR